MSRDLVLIAVLWSLWCMVHSLLAAPAVTAFFRRRLGALFAWFRLAYNLVALLTLLPLAVWTFSLPYGEILSWRGPWVLLQAAAWLTAAWLFWAGARVYPIEEFLGVEQIRNWRRGEKEKGGKTLVTSGVSGMVRHPWYLAGLLVLWARDLTLPDLVVNAVLSLYLVLGARIEERKLIAEFGERYHRYQKAVPMLIPWKWLKERVWR